MIARALVAALASLIGCAAAPINLAVSTNAELGKIAADPEVRSRGSALTLDFELSNASGQPVWVCMCATAIHIDSVTRDGYAVQPELLDINTVADARAYYKHQVKPLEGDREMTLRSEGLAEAKVEHDQWRLAGYKLMRGRYRVVFSYQYDGPDFGHANVFRGKVVSRAVTFTVE